MLQNKYKILDNKQIPTGIGAYSFNYSLNFNGYNRVKFLVTVNGTMPTGFKMDFVVSSSKIGEIDRYVYATTEDKTNTKFFTDIVIEKYHLFDTTTMVFSIPLAPVLYNVTIYAFLIKEEENDGYEPYLVKII